VQEKDNASSGTPKASNTKILSTGKKLARATLTNFFASDKVARTGVGN